MLSRFTRFIRPIRLIKPLWIDGGVLVAIRAVVGLTLPSKSLTVWGELFYTNWNHLNAPELRVFTHSDHRNLFRLTEKGIAQKSWVKSDHRLARHCNFGGKETVLQLHTQHCRFNVSSHTLYINPGTYQESPLAPLDGFWPV